MVWCSSNIRSGSICSPCPRAFISLLLLQHIPNEERRILFNNLKIVCLCVGLLNCKQSDCLTYNQLFDLRENLNAISDP